MKTEEAASYSSASSNSNSRRMTMSSSKLLLNPVAVLLGLILNQDWKMIRTLIAATSPDCFRDLADSISSCSQHKLNGMTLLHAIVRDNPPLELLPTSSGCARKWQPREMASEELLSTSQMARKLLRCCSRPSLVHTQLHVMPRTRTEGRHCISYVTLPLFSLQTMKMQTHHLHLKIKKHQSMKLS